MMFMSIIPIVIEDDVWISFGVTVLKGVRIGAKSVISAGSIGPMMCLQGVFME